MATINYTTLQDIREEAGLQKRVNGESPAGVIDGANKDFYVKQKYIVDRDYSDDGPQPGDVTAYVNDIAVEVSAIDATTGKISLTDAPAGGTKVKIDYQFSVLSDEGATKRRTEANGWINRRVKNVVNLADLSDDAIADFGMIARLYSAALLLIRDYGSSADTDLSSKDGYKKLQTARELLSEYVGDMANDNDAPEPESVSSRSDGNIFARNTDLSADGPSRDDEFFNHD